jgi:pyruvate formate lyase activating enzyme
MQSEGLHLESVGRALTSEPQNPPLCPTHKALLDREFQTTQPVASVHEDWRHVTGFVHSEETGGMADGPGVRHVLFLSGCVLRCQYCHNPDTWELRNGLPTTAEAVVASIARSTSFLRRHGGVTISGGEPLVQARFTAAIFRGCKELGLHTALDTNGYLGHRISDEVLEDTDLVLLDIKEWDPLAYRELTGVPLAPTLRFAGRLAQQNRPVWLRYVLVPGLTDNPDRIQGLAEFAASLGNVQRVEVLPFHKMGESKWQRLGLPYRLTNTPTPTHQQVLAAQDVFLNAGLAVPGRTPAAQPA